MTRILVPYSTYALYNSNVVKLYIHKNQVYVCMVLVLIVSHLSEYITV